MGLNSGDVLRLCVDERPKLADFSSAEVVRLEIQHEANCQKNLEDYDALVRFLCETANTRVDRLLVDVCHANTEFKENSTVPLHFCTWPGVGELLRVEALAHDTIRAVKMRLFDRTGIETNTMLLTRGGLIRWREFKTRV